ncbi:MAG: ATP-binding protein [Mariniphaga sp.]
MELRTSLEKKEDDKNLVLIEIQDNGSGMPEDVKKNIFEPFFSTKEAKDESTGGSGLGLSVCYGIIQNHGIHSNHYIVVKSAAMNNCPVSYGDIIANARR